MNNISLDLIDIDFTDDTDVDEMFEQLEQFTPPADMVARIMHKVAELPISYGVPTSSWTNLDILAIAK
jgi:hypothetical protein